MKDQLFEMLLSLFEQALTNIREHQLGADGLSSAESASETQNDFQFCRAQSEHSSRVLTMVEQLKLTKPAIQFLMRLLHTGTLHSVQFEQVMNVVLDSNLVYVTLADLGMMIHQVLSESLSQRELLMFEFTFDLETIPTTMH